MRKLIFLSALLILLAANGFSSVGIDQFQKANQFYREGKFTDAIPLYEELSQKTHSSAIYYNLGNAYFKQEKLGLAILNYERAKNLRPRDSDILGNLAYVQRLIQYKIEDKRNWYSRKLSRVLGSVTFEECIVVVFFAYFAFILGLLALIVLKRRFSFAGALVSFLIVIFCSFPLLLKHLEFGAGRRGVVTEAQAEAHYGPSTSDKIAFRLVEGLEVNLTQEKEDWYQIALRDGRRGWIAKSELTVI